ncbi:hypothetical protein [Methylobacterium aerolatum]|uniref:Uncharacterized protein n=1 Tax=Methylobacterium aerolatum TaxID=418708 RepID=A0ABU0I7W5_9HYPH|nr:hypothetical protein [Methylobacterium aerolatum]MDQ0449965.1 hypothetical protein [Methylobacterium aerolatum]GJD37474.1 hypothetical protein FMGBMHLM_4406 [Methylobacterium aerolatum]
MARSKGTSTPAGATGPAAEAPGFEPFADDAACRTIGGLSVENGTTRITLHGSLDIPRDRAGLAQARLLRETLEAIVRTLEAAPLPEEVAEAADLPSKTVKNPFA